MRAAAHREEGPVPVVINLDAHRERAAHPVSRPTVKPLELPLGECPKCCRQSSVTVQGHVMPCTRQELPWQTLRAHIEGGNGRLKSVDSALLARERRQPRGRVAQALLFAIAVMVHKLKELEQYLVASGKSPITGLADILPSYPSAAETAMPALEA